MVLDCTLIVLHKPLNAIKVAEEKGVQHYRDSYASAYLMMQDGTLMDALISFSEDHLNEETMELLQPYLENPLFSFEGARKTSAMAASLLTWLKALDDYYGVAGALNPRKRKLGVKESDLASQKRSLVISGKRRAFGRARAFVFYTLQLRVLSCLSDFVWYAYRGGPEQNQGRNGGNASRFARGCQCKS